MKKLACLKTGENEIKVEYQRMKDVDSTGLTVELKSEEQFTSDEYLINFREDPDTNGEPKSITKKFNCNIETRMRPGTTDRNRIL